MREVLPNMKMILVLVLLYLVTPVAALAQVQFPSAVSPSILIPGEVIQSLNAAGQATPISASNPLPVAGTFSATLAGFTPNGNYGTLTATGSSSSSTALPSGVTVRITNTGTTAVSCTLNTGSATGARNNIIIEPGSSAYRVPGTYANIACIDQGGSDSTSNVVVLEGGSGLANDSGGGGGSGSGGTVNVAQFGGTNVVTGTGVGGSGIPRVTVSSDSSLSVTNINSNGQKTMANSSPIVIASDQSAVPVQPFAPNSQYGTPLSVSSTTAQTVLPTNGGVVVLSSPSSSTVTAYCNLGTSSAVTATTSDMPISPGGSIGLAVGTNTNVACITASGTATINTAGGSGLFTGAGGGGGGGGSGGTVNVAQFGGTNVVTGTGASGSGVPRVTVSSDSSLAVTNVNSNGQKTMANSSPVVVASDQSAIPITGPVTNAGTFAVQCTSGCTGGGTVTANQGTAGGSAWPVTDSTVNSTLGTTNSTLSSILSAVENGAGATGSMAPTYAIYMGIDSGGNLIGWNGAVAQNGTWTVQPGNTANTTPWLVDVNNANSNGQKTMSGSSPIVIASDQSAVPVTGQASASAGDLCFGTVKSFADVETTTGTGVAVVNGVSGKKIYVCGATIVTSAAANASLIEGSSSTCGTSSTAGVFLNTGVTAANGAAFAANGGISRGDGNATIAQTSTAANYLCVLFTTTNSPQVNVHLAYVQQ
jgi:hypothetical protein